MAASLYDILTGDEEARLCRDIPESACRHRSENFVIHVASLAATKTGDGLADPKLVLTWLLQALGAPAAAIGLLVPLRESLALLPQLFTSAQIRALPQRKWVWGIGSVVQGVMVAGMGFAALFLEGAALGWTIVALLTVFALARSACSVSYKDVLGKTVGKTLRGTATGTAGTISAVAVFAFGASLATGILPLEPKIIAYALFCAAVLWVAAGSTFLLLAEESGATDGGKNALDGIVSQFRLLREDRQLVVFIAVRGLLIATALAPPFILTLGAEAGQAAAEDAAGTVASLGQLGPFIIASSLASISSSYVWGRLADSSSRKVLALSATGGALGLGLAALAGYLLPGLVEGNWFLPVLIFLVYIAYQGVRLGRSTHLVDMADEKRRASYTALSNTIIGILLVMGGIFGFIAQWISVAFVLAIFSLMCIAAALLALKLEEVQAE